MTTNNKLLVASGVGLLLYALSGSTTATASTVDTSSDIGPATVPTTPKKKPAKVVPPTSGSASGFPLRKGSRGEKVRKLQAWLGVGADGIFGAKTEAALYQRTTSKTVATEAAYNALLASATAANQSAPASTPDSGAALAAALFTACYSIKNVPVMGGDIRAPNVTGNRSIADFRAAPDVDTIARVLSPTRPDAEIRGILGAYTAKYGTLTGGGFAHTLDHWNATALKLYGLWAIRIRLGNLVG